MVHYQLTSFFLITSLVLDSTSPQFSFDQRPGASQHPAADDINYRAIGSSNYRNFYRNRNYFVQQDKSSEAPPPSSTSVKYESPQPIIKTSPPSTTTMPSSSSTVQRSRTVGQMLMGSNDPIHFEDATPYSAYIRPIEPVQPTTSADDDNIVQSSNGALPSLDSEKNPSCPELQTLGYCEVVDKYPEKLLNEVLQRSITPSEFQKMYGDTTDNSTKTTDLKSILERTGLNTAPEETPLCSAIEHTIYPKVAKSKDNKWMFVVNHDEYIQGVRIEKCLDEGQSCFYGDTGPSSYVTACRQKYIYKKLLALTPEGKTSSESFKLPSCCACYVKTVSFSDRLLSGRSTGAPPSGHDEDVDIISTVPSSSSD